MGGHIPLFKKWQKTQKQFFHIQCLKIDFFQKKTRVLK